LPGRALVVDDDLGISVRTVEVHRARVMDRLGTRQLAKAVRFAMMARLAPGRGLDAVIT
jgi:FixJ family two-component response regulator